MEVVHIRVDEKTKNTILSRHQLVRGHRRNIVRRLEPKEDLRKGINRRGVLKVAMGMEVIKSETFGRWNVSEEIRNGLSGGSG